jgi:hypothetical protein
MSELAEKIKKIGRNDPCHCNSGKKYKKCHLLIDEKAQQLENKKTEEIIKKSKEDEKEDEKEVVAKERVIAPQKTFNKNPKQSFQKFRIPRRSNG